MKTLSGNSKPATPPIQQEPNDVPLSVNNPNPLPFDFTVEADAVAPDIHTSSDAYAERFAGSHGAYLLSVQSQAMLDMLAPWAGGRVLSVGGGHAQLAPSLIDAGYDLTIQGSSDACRLRPDRVVGPDRYSFVQGNALALPLEDRSFDVAVAVRMMAHIAQPERLVAELCRVARYAVVIDFSRAGGLFSRDSKLAYYLKQCAEHSTARRYKSHELSEVQAMFACQGMTPDRRIGQFCLPMALHRLAGPTRIPRGIEWLAAQVGLRSHLGSPMLIRAVRPEGSPEEHETRQETA